MSGENWRPGDLALCVNDGELGGYETYGGITSGSIYTVERAFYDYASEHVLLLSGIRAENADGGWLVERFIKVTPPEADEFDRETIELYSKKPEKANA